MRVRSGVGVVFIVWIGGLRMYVELTLTIVGGKMAWNMAGNVREIGAGVESRVGG